MSILFWSLRTGRSFLIKYKRHYSQHLHKDTSSVISKEISQFGKLSDKWWDLEGEFKALHSMNRLRTELVRKGVSSQVGVVESLQKGKPLHGIKILDIGCGGGILSEALARMGGNVTGLDACPEAIEAAQKHSSLDPSISSNLNYILGTAEEEALEKTNYYDVVVSSEVIEHVANQNTFLESCSNLLKENGSLFLTTINRTTCSWILAIGVAENILKVVPKGIHDWNKFITPQEIEEILLTHGCRTTRVSGMFYNPFLNSWSWFNDDGINYALHAVKTKSSESVSKEDEIGNVL